LNAYQASFGFTDPTQSCSANVLVFFLFKHSNLFSPLPVHCYEHAEGFLCFGWLKGCCSVTQVPSTPRIKMSPGISDLEQYRHVPFFHKKSSRYQ
jgi:hypothetical protein